MKFKLGSVVMTTGAQEELTESDILSALRRYVACDWGELCATDKKLNDDAVVEDQRILASYTSKNGVKFWIITEWDRSVTTILLPEEY